MLLFVCLFFCLYVYIDWYFFAVNDMRGYFVITAFDNDNKSSLILSCNQFPNNSSPKDAYNDCVK